MPRLRRCNSWGKLRRTWATRNFQINNSATQQVFTTYSLHVQHIQQTSQDEAILSLFLLDYIYDFVVSFVDASSYFLSTFSYVFRALERVFLVKVFRPFPFFHLFPLLQVWVLFREACGAAGVWKEWKATWPHIFWSLGTVLCCFDLFWQLQIQGMGKGMGKMGKGLNIWQPMFMKDTGIAANQRTWHAGTSRRPLACKIIWGYDVKPRSAGRLC